MDKVWLKHYPEGMPAEIDADHYPSLVALLEDSFKKNGRKDAYIFLGRHYSFADIDQQSRALMAYFQSVGLERGDRVALMMPNVPQYPVAVAAVLRAGLVVVNVNPLYTARELEHQLKDSGAKAIVILENFAHVLQHCQKAVAVKHVVLAAMGDRMGMVKGAVVNYVVRKVKKLVPPFALEGEPVRFNEALALGARLPLKPVSVGPDDIAVLQYTGGTTGVSKGAVLKHRNIIANLLQSEAWYAPAIRKVPPGEQLVTICALPLYHIFAFTVNMMLSLHMGGCNVLVPNPRDLPALFKDLMRQPFHTFPAVNTLFAAVAHHPDVGKVDWSSMVLSVGGGTAVQQGTARLWMEKTGCPIIEGYGLSEASPVVACNPGDSRIYTGTIGMPVPSTEIDIKDDEGRSLPIGKAGELCIRGPQIMAGYWQRPDETARVMTPDGYLRTGDIGIVDERGYIRLVDRKKDMIIVSGFNVYPNEVEDIVTLMPGVLECAVVGVPDERSGEAVKLFVVRDREDLTEAQVRAHCEENLTGYKRPRFIEFRPTLPKTPVGKVLRRELREAA